ncbi:hypothetical protein RHMOL_Rhmol11G0055900 [Rhododendron molle]|uniref:Uncharacterized protein n=1 Tax=Rhododendron molle TaxID=49168 RepID=A0ACC0LQ66_RHOML|nr:hypothetical protein RHMOL_Rhmol11G0055900 [Rhododendron molle]
MLIKLGSTNWKQSGRQREQIHWMVSLYSCFSINLEPTKFPEKKKNTSGIRNLLLWGKSFPPSAASLGLSTLW